MTEDDLNKILNFCRKTKISHLNLHEITTLFQKKYPHFPSYAFEICLLELRKKPALNARDACLKYYESEKDLGYYKFCREQMLVSMKFWSACVKDVKIKPEDIIQEPSMPYQPSFDSKKKPQESPKEGFESLLPVSWHSMSRSDRIEFVKRIRHEGFREYVLEIDPSLKNYFSLIKNKTQSGRMKLYVTLFSIPANCSEEAKNLLKCFVDNLNSFGRANLQFVECKDPDIIEIREMR